MRNASLRHDITVADLATRAGTSPNSISRLEKGDPGSSIGTLADILVVLGLVDRLAELIDVRKDDLGLALPNKDLPRRGKSFLTKARKPKVQSGASRDHGDVIDLDKVSF